MNEIQEKPDRYGIIWPSTEDTRYHLIDNQKDKEIIESAGLVEYEKTKMLFLRCMQLNIEHKTYEINLTYLYCE